MFDPSEVRGQAGSHGVLALEFQKVRREGGQVIGLLPLELCQLFCFKRSCLGALRLVLSVGGSEIREVVDEALLIVSVAWGVLEGALNIGPVAGIWLPREPAGEPAGPWPVQPS